MSGYPGHHHHHHQERQVYDYGPPQGPPPGQVPGFPAPPPGYGGGGYGGYNAPPGPPPQAGGYAQSYAPSYGAPYAPPSGPPPPGGSYGGYGGQGGGYEGYSRDGGYGGQEPYGRPEPNYGSHPTSGGGQYMPPTEVQNYGPHFQGPDNRDAQPYFQYSQCTGRKKALCIGINYFGQDAELKGCINDAHNVRRFLISHGYSKDDIVMLTDDAQNPRQIPTKNNIMEAMEWLVRDAQPHDSLFFHYSGHGGQTKDLDGDEADGFDEVIYPVDFQQASHIVDDDMFFIMVKPLPPGCRLTAIFDSCHSGSVLDLPYIYSTEGKIKEPNLAAEAGMGLLSVAKSYAQKDMQGVLKGAMSLFKTATGSTQKAEAYARQTRTSPADVISWSGCKDSQTSADTVEAGSATGAMSYAFISSLSQQPQQTYQQLLINLRGVLRDKYSQKPQLSSSHPMDTNIIFII
ncbi:hypothetical protein M0805_005202 [Coniferiporia weirii]|nr:hypothetical protein M0805_005202 [Coniferiporia weirii]